jgi:autotransporter-associated beta strand protein
LTRRTLCAATPQSHSKTKQPAARPAFRAAFGLTILTLSMRAALADPTWVGTTSSDFTNAQNWSGGSPGSTVLAQFGVAAQTEVTISGAQAIVRGIVFEPGAAAYSLDLVSGGGASQSLTIGSGGVLNLSSVIQHLSTNGLDSSIVITGQGASVTGQVEFDNLTLLASTTFSAGASAGSAVIVNSGGGQTVFQNASAGASVISVGAGSELSFLGQSTAGLAHITTTSSGSVIFNDASDAGTASLVNAGTLVFASTSSAGSARITNTSTVLFGDQSTAGAASITNMNGASLRFTDQSGAGTALIQNQAGATILFSGTASAPLAQIVNAAGGLVDVSGTSASSVAIGSLSGAGNVNLGPTTLVLGGAGRNDVLSGELSGTTGGLTKVGSGTLTLSGSSAFPGPTEVDAGTLALSGTLAGSVGVNAGATLTGTGSIGGGLALGSNAQLLLSLPGSALHVTGNVNLAPNSVMTTTLAPGGLAGSLVSTGQVQLQGATLNIMAEGAQASYAARSVYTVIESGAATSGQFTSLESNLSSLVPEVRYLTNEVEVILEPAVIAPPTGNPSANQTATAQGLAGIAALVVPLSDATQSELARDLRLLGASAYGALRRIALDDDDQFVREVAERNQLHGRGPDPEPDQSAWLDLIGQSGHVVGDANASGYQSSASGLLGGFYPVRSNTYRLGIAGEIEHGHLGLDDLSASAQTDSTRIALVASESAGAVEVSGELAGSWESAWMHRSILLPGLEATATSRTATSGLSGLIRVDWPCQTPGGVVVPYGALQWTSSGGGGMSEHGAGVADLSGGVDTLNLTTTSLGVALFDQIDVAWFDKPLQLDASLAWLHAMGAVDPAVLAHFDASPNATGFDSGTVHLAADSGLLFAGVSTDLSRDLSIGGRISVLANARAHEGYAFLGLRYRW